ncbi:MAG TPA: flagellar hook assembly protein FlgD [Spirochaetales bacterium]|nr:flagellar hook assembly protein FlgD [Spirochaetales bacterium]
MDISSVITGSDFLDLNNRVESYNKTITGARQGKQVLDKDDFLKILVTQLSHQDPTQPMEDREFIAQMAQFSTLEQMTNLNREFSQVMKLMAASQAVNLLGKTVEIADGESFVQGSVQEILGGESPQLLVNDHYYDYSAVRRVME